MSAWRDLPNAAHIDRIIESLKSHINIWAVALDESHGEPRREAWYVALDAVLDAARLEAWDSARAAAWDTARNLVRDLVQDGDRDLLRDWAWEAAWSAIAALVAWDDSDRFLDMTGNELAVWARLSNNPAAILMLPAVRALEQTATCLDTGSKSACWPFMLIYP